MTDHETFVLLAAKQLSEPLSPREEAELAAHLKDCPSCRSIATGMRRDNIRLQAELGAAPVSPRVRARVLDEASADGASMGASCSVSRRFCLSELSAFHSSSVDGARPPRRRPRRRTADRRSDAVRRRPRLREPSPVGLTQPCPLRRRNPGRSSPGRTCTAQDRHAATPSPPSSRRVNRPASGRESALLMGPGTRTPGRSRAS